MSESWPLFFVLGYFVTLIISLFKQKTLVQEELKYFSWYFMVSVIAAVWAHDRYQSARMEPAVGVDINLMGMLRIAWYEYIIPYSGAYSILSSVRLIILFLKEYKIKRTKDKTRLATDST